MQEGKGQRFLALLLFLCYHKENEGVYNSSWEVLS